MNKTKKRDLKIKYFRMKFLEYTDAIDYGDLVIVYISTEDLKQIKVTKDETYQTKFGYLIWLGLTVVKLNSSAQSNTMN